MLFCASLFLFNFPAVTIYVINTIRALVIGWFTCSVLKGQRLLTRVAWRISIKEQKGQKKSHVPGYIGQLSLICFLKKKKKLNKLNHLGKIKDDKEQLFFLWWTNLNIKKKKLQQKWTLGAEKHRDADIKLDGRCDLERTLSYSLYHLYGICNHSSILRTFTCDYI